MKPSVFFVSLVFASGLTAPVLSAEIGGINVSAHDWAYVQDYCATLEADGIADAADEEPSTPAELSTPTIELRSVTYADCQAAGLIAGAPMTMGSTLTDGGPMQVQLLHEDDD